MDTSKLGRGEMIAAVSGIALLIVMFLFDWFSVDLSDAGGLFEVSVGGNAWDTLELIRWLLLLTAIVAVGLAVLKANSQKVDLPVAGSALVAGLGILSALFVLIRIISPPDGGAGVDVGRDIGVFLGFLATLGVAYGGWQAMSEEGTSFTEQRDRLGSRGGGSPGPPPAA